MDIRISTRKSRCQVCWAYIHPGDRIAFINPAPRVRARIAVHARHVEVDRASYRIARRENEVV